MKGVPKCGCGGVIKPDVVLYEEGLDNEVIERSIAHIRKADMLIIGGTSLVVYPAAGWIDYYHGNKLVLINKSATSRDGQADLVMSDSFGKVLGTRSEYKVVTGREEMVYEVGDIVKSQSRTRAAANEWEIPVKRGFPFENVPAAGIR